MKVIDKYIMKRFLTTFVFSICLIIIIVIIFDISEKIDDFLSNNAPLKAIIFDYYLNFVPNFVNLFIPLFTFISAIFFTSRMASNSEIIAILTGGISFMRMLRPYIYSSLIICFISIVLSNFIMPIANYKRIEFENKYIKKNREFTEGNIHIQISKNEQFYISGYNNITKIASGFNIERYDGRKLLYKLYANYAVWDDKNSLWILQDYYERRFNGLKEKIITGKEKKIKIKITPKDFNENVSNVEMMNYFELNQFIKEEKAKGSNALPFYYVEKYQRTANAFTTIILTLIAVALSSRKLRGGVGVHIGMGIALSFTYILFMQISKTFALYGNLNPFIGVWIPNLIFGIISIFLIKLTPK